MVIVGAGECGARAAFALRDNGYSGPVTLVGDEVHLPYERPPLTKGAMLAPEAPLPTFIGTSDRFAAADIDIRTANPAVRIQRESSRVELASGEVIPYAKLLIATGATPRQHSAASPGSIYLRNFGDAMLVRSRLGAGRSLVVVGGGFIGLELAAAARQLGSEVTVIEAQPRILMRGVPAEIAERVAELHLANGVALICGDQVASIDDIGSQTVVTTASGVQVTADVCVIGIGCLPNVRLSSEAGLAMDNGVAVDAFLQTSDPNIYAAGDCCSFPLPMYDGQRARLESYRNAQQQGALAAANMLGGASSYAAVPWFWSDQYDHTLFVAGLTSLGTQAVHRPLDGGSSIYFHLDGAGQLVAASGIGQGNAVAKEIRLAEMIIAKQMRPAAEMLANPDQKLKSILAGN